jgi:hypothetical protein
MWVSIWLGRTPGVRFLLKTAHTHSFLGISLVISALGHPLGEQMKATQRPPNRALTIELCLSSRFARMHRSASSSHRSRRAQEEGRRRTSLVHVDVCRSRVSRTY